MRLSLLSAALALALSGIRAQQLPPTFTPCITNCLEQAITQDLSSCSTPGVQCLCANAKTQQAVSSCLQQQCTTQDIGAVQAIVADECAPAANSTSTHSEAPSWSWSLSVHTGRSSEAYPSGKPSVSFSATTIVLSTRLSLSTPSASATSLANSTNLISATSATPVAPSSPASSLSDAASTTASAAPAGTNAAARVGHDGIRVYAVLGAVLGGAAIW